MNGQCDGHNGAFPQNASVKQMRNEWKSEKKNKKKCVSNSNAKTTMCPPPPSKHNKNKSSIRGGLK
jgi:hypothetical protein